MAHGRGALCNPAAPIHRKRGSESPRNRMPESQCVLGKAEVYGPLSQGVVLARLRHINERASVRRELATAAALAGEGGYGAVLDQRTGQIEFGWLGHRRGNCAEELRSLDGDPEDSWCGWCRRSRCVMDSFLEVCWVIGGRGDGWCYSDEALGRREIGLRSLGQLLRPWRVSRLKVTSRDSPRALSALDAAVHTLRQTLVY